MKLLFSLFLLLLLNNCLNNNKNIFIEASHIKLNDDIYLKPIGRNEHGCSMFFPYSLSGNMVTQVIYFLNKKNIPTTTSNPVGCK